MSLLRAESEDAVEELLKNHDFWDNSNAWRMLGDSENNFSTIGNQQSRSDAALAEKIINSVDARLINECLLKGIKPDSAEAPSDIREAVQVFFDAPSGFIGNWDALKRREQAKFITLSATGERSRPCISIADMGEGQTPINIPHTFMSIAKSNKIRIPFVQGKFNMGGTGVLKFCGSHSFQLLITRRNPNLVDNSDSTNKNWGFTITRRELPKGEKGSNRNSVFKYLAPEKEQNVLSFVADALPLMPVFNEAYRKDIEFGTLIKLYSYDMKGFYSNILRKDGLLYRLDCLLPEIALPVNLHECRDFRGKKESSFVTMLSGLSVRLEEGKGNNLEEGFPDSIPFKVSEEQMNAKIYAFKGDKAETYTTNEGVIFTINGQTHGMLPKTLFGRKKVRLGRLTKALLVLVDCSSINSATREDLFMNSRDRLSQHHLRKEIENEIEDILSHHPKLKELANTRAKEDISKRLADSKPLEDILKSIIDKSPALRSLLPNGQRINNPFNFKSGEHNNGDQGDGVSPKGGDGPGSKPFVGKKHPSYFRFLKKKTGEVLKRNYQIDRRCRITLETDVENEYFGRSSDPGMFTIEIIDDSGKFQDAVVQNNLLLHDGLAHWSLKLPDEMEISDTIEVKMTITDETIDKEFVNIAKLTAQPTIQAAGKQSQRRSSSSGGGGQEPTKFALPNIIPVDCEDWGKYGFDAKSALKPMQEQDGTYTFVVNIANDYLLLEAKADKDFELLKAQYIYGLVLIGIALLQENTIAGHAENSTEEESITEKIENISRAVATVIIPIIRSLSKVTAEEISSGGQLGDDE